MYHSDNLKNIIRIKNYNSSTFKPLATFDFLVRSCVKAFLLNFSFSFILNFLAMSLVYNKDLTQMYNITMFSKHISVTAVFSMLASVRIASHAEITCGHVTTSDEILLSGISFTTPALYFRKTFSHSVAIVIKDSHGVHNLTHDRESMYSF